MLYWYVSTSGLDFSFSTRWQKIKENKCPRRNFKLKEEEKEEEEEEEEEEICKHGCTFIIYMVKKIGKKLEKEHF